MRPSESHRHLATLFATADVTELGEGDQIAGANLLASMALTLGNLARPGAGIELPSGRLLPVGTNLLATGSLISSLVTDVVIASVGRFQDNLLAQLTRLLKDDAAEQAKSAPRKWVISRGAKSTPGENALFQLMTRDPEAPQIDRTEASEWLTVLSESPSLRLEDLLQNPRPFIACHNRSDLTKLLPSANMGDALVALSLTRAKDASDYGDICPPLMDGLFPGGPSGQLIRGRLLVIDHHGVLREVARNPTVRDCWLSRLVWLVEGNVGPGIPPKSEEDSKSIKLPNLTNRFDEAARALIADRLSPSQHESQIHKFDISPVQTRWMEFLRDTESVLPGISGAARSLLPSLVFGLVSLSHTSNRPENFRFQIVGVEAFAQFLIQRMASARNEMQWTMEEARRIELKQLLKDKLADGSQTARGLTRRFHRLPMSQCNELLIELQKEGAAESEGGEWRLTTN